MKNIQKEKTLKSLEILHTYIHYYTDKRGVELRKKVSNEKKIWKNAGVTLVVLVITIIVLMILAAVGISLINGEDGLFNKSKQAGDEYIARVQEEKNELSYYTNYIESYINGERATYEERIAALETQVTALNALINGKNVEMVTAWSGTNNSGTVSLGTYNLFDYDYIVLTARNNKNKFTQTCFNSIGALSIGDSIAVYNDAWYTYYTVTDGSTLTYNTSIQSGQYDYLERVELIKFN